MKQHYKDLMSIEDIQEKDAWSWISNLIESACISPDEKVFCDNINEEPMDEDLRDMLIAYLLDAQPDRIRNAQNYSQRDIQNLLKQL